MKIVACVWRLCGECEAPITRPLPQGWTYTVVRRKNRIDQVTVHREDCPDGFQKVVVAGDDL